MGLTVAVGCDHAGFPLKEEITSLLHELGHEVVDVGTDGLSSVDYPDFARAAARLVAEGRCDRAILLCGTGQGMAMTANKVAGVRCGVCTDAFSARMTRAHNDANALAMGARVVGPDLATDIARAFLSAEFEEGRHVGRVAKIRCEGERP